MLKDQLRREMISRREAMDSHAVRAQSEKICALLTEIKEFRATDVIMAYVPVRNEVDITPFWLKAWDQGKKVLLPRVEENQLVAVAFTGWEKTKTGSFGIIEPLGPSYPLECIEAVLVPGVAFDRLNYRLGYGKGYYDRFLPKLKSEAFTCGVAYDFQVVDTIHPTGRDFKLNMVVRAG